MTALELDSGGSHVCTQQNLVVALGIISAPSYHGRRMAQRHSWMRWSNVGQSGAATICSSFVVRAGDAPRGITTALQREADVHGDLLLVRSIPYNESRVRGPILSLAWWLLYAARSLPRARYIGKLDDDAYLHAPDLESMLGSISTQLEPAAKVYLGVLTWYHWYPTLFDNTRHAWTFRQAIGVGSWCRGNDLVGEGCEAGSPGAATSRLYGNLTAETADSLNSLGCGRCRGPFAFAAGYLVILSRPLLEGVVARGGLAADARRLYGLDALAMRNKQGKPLEQVMEDVWLGYILHAFPLPEPVRYISLLGDKKSSLYVDAWDFRLSRTAVLTHVITKQLERFLALHYYTSDKVAGVHCSPTEWKLRCAAYCGTRKATRHLPEWCSAQSEGAARRRPEGDGFDAVAPSKASPLSRWLGVGRIKRGGLVTDEWCTVRAIRQKESFTSTDGTCCGPANKSCTQLFGSNSWPVRFRPVLKQMKRFQPVGQADLIAAAAAPAITASTASSKKSASTLKEASMQAQPGAHVAQAPKRTSTNKYARRRQVRHFKQIGAGG